MTKSAEEYGFSFAGLLLQKSDDRKDYGEPRARMATLIGKPRKMARMWSFWGWPHRHRKLTQKDIAALAGVPGRDLEELEAVAGSAGSRSADSASCALAYALCYQASNVCLNSRRSYIAVQIFL